MLSQEDLQFMFDTRREVIANRRREIEIEYRSSVGVKNKATGVIEYPTLKKKVLSVVTDRTSRVAAERRLREQAEVVEGDIWFSISVEELGGIDAKRIVYAYHNGDKYSVLSEDPKGIGIYNRHEFVGKRTT
ncbi:hypothetical protein [Macrococcus capreoli]|uniref:hypothetical protein n=1 Tax=Macrococcus capreoli TaxID=2982690 RepID=UPI0021D56C79|nr:hypothetical protein [Macrococcus sp. TMW 2.2395]MCU7556535.1 hypothetical protein [Macrococcus sp. TMW 2.2395]